jgi:hypothetical protein
MAIDFKQQTFFDPKIDIIGKEVPLAEIEKTGNVLQNRFDESYKQYSAADEALKQMEARANPVDREKAKELRGLYKSEMDKILEQGDFHNMRRQTENLARNAAINYKVIEEKNAAIQKGLEEIAKSPKYQLDPEGAKQEYLKSIQSINFNPETRTISDFNVGAYNAAADFQTADKLLQIAPTLRAKLLKAKGSYFGTRTLPTGQKVNTIETEGGGYRILEDKEIENELKSYIVTDPAFQAYITRDVGRMGLDPKSEEGKVAYNQLVAERTADTSKALGKMYEIDENMAQTTFTVPGGDVNGSGGDKDKDKPQFTQRPSNIFKLNPGVQPFEVDANGNITSGKQYIKPVVTGSPVMMGTDNTFSTDIQDALNVKNSKNALENSTTYKRAKEHLMQLGVITDKSTKLETGKAIANFWNNEIQDAAGSITVAEPGNKAANDFLAQYNSTYFGTPTPDANTTGTSILQGQLAQATFTNERGELKSAQQVFDLTKDKNVRINGWVGQVRSPYEYGSPYMTAVDPKNGKQFAYLIEPDQNTKNSGAYFANRIYNSVKKTELVSKWKDGNGTNFEATPVKGGKSYILYLNGDDSAPIFLSATRENENTPSDMEILETLPSGQANQYIYDIYNSKKNK